MATKNYGDWQISKQLGAGGQGSVYLATHGTTGQTGALKRLTNPKRLARFKSEIEILRKLRHESVVPLLDARLDAEPYFAVFEYEPGGSLADLPTDALLRTPISVRLGWCDQVASGLEAAHDNECIHRDIKPENILLNEARSLARVCDFGLVFIDGGERVTVTEEQVGSRYYIAPECEEGRAESVCPATDIYSLGKVVYYVLTGRVFSRERHREPRNDLAETLGNPYMELVSRVLDRCITDRTETRYASVADFRADLADVVQSIELRAPVPGVEETYKCMFCRRGTYRVTSLSKDMHNAGYKEGNIGNEEMVFLECDDCGNCQRFKLKYGADRWFPDVHNAYQSEHTPRYQLKPRPGVVFPT